MVKLLRDFNVATLPVILKSSSKLALVMNKFGMAIFKFLSITIADFMIAGGILLFVFSMSDLITEEKIQRKIDSENLGVVPSKSKLLFSTPAVCIEILQ